MAYKNIHEVFKHPTPRFKMTPETVIGIFGQALFLVVVLVAAIILPSLLVGLIVSVFSSGNSN